MKPSMRYERKSTMDSIPEAEAVEQNSIDSPSVHGIIKKVRFNTDSIYGSFPRNIRGSSITVSKDGYSYQVPNEDWTSEIADMPFDERMKMFAPETYQESIHTQFRSAQAEFHATDPMDTKKIDEIQKRLHALMQEMPDLYV